MALKKCPECGKDISTDAERCPHCGKLLSKVNIGRVLILLVLVLLALALLGYHVL